MNNKKMKRILGYVCASALLLGAIPANGIVASAEDATDQEYVDVVELEEQDKISLHGVKYDKTDGLFVRMPLDEAAGIAGITDEERENYVFENSTTKKLVNNVYTHVREAAGGRMRFSTDSSYVAIRATLQHWAKNYATRMGDGKYGFDVYEDTETGSTYIGTLSPETTPTATGEVAFTDRVELGDEGTMRNLTIYFPITTETKSVEIGVADNCTIGAHGKSYNDPTKRILFYGSSITQGGEVTRPGNTYVNTVGRNLNRDYLNLGVWGSCKGQPSFATYMNTLGNISAFVLDYDHNENFASTLESKHYAFYQAIREAYNDIPIVIMTRPGKSIENNSAHSTVAEMKAVIYETYQRAVNAGDTNVHFIDGEVFFGYDTQYFTDGTHPTDAGQARMAEVVTDVLGRALEGEENICVVDPTCDLMNLMNETFEEDLGGWTTDGGNANFSFTRTEDSELQLTYATASKTSSKTSYVGYDTRILKGYSNFVVDMDDVTLSKVTNGSKTSWTRLGVAFRDSTNGTLLEFLVGPSSDGVWIIPFFNTIRGDSVRNQDETATADEQLANLAYTAYDDANTSTSRYYIKMVNTEIGGAYTGTECNFDLSVAVEQGADYTNTYTFTVTANGATSSSKFVITNFANAATSPRLYLRAHNSVDGTYKATIDNISVYTESHVLDEIPANDMLGTEAHHECKLCGTKFKDAHGTEPVTDLTDLGYVASDEITYQKKQNAQTAENTDIRFVVYVDDYTKYQSVTFKITCGDKTGEKICKNAYTAVYAYEEKVAPEDLYGQEGYFATFILGNNTAEQLSEKMTITVTWTKLDGTTEKITREVTVLNN